MSRHQNPLTLLSVGLVLLAGAVPAAAQPQDGPDYRSANGRLPVAAPQVRVHSYNGVVYQVVNRAGRDPMAVVVTNVQPGSKLVLERQGRSKALGQALSGQLRLEDLQRLAESALVWKGAQQIAPVVDSTRGTHVELVKEPGKVFWPNSRVRLTGSTRDGQEIPEVRLNVDGLQNQTETVYNHATRNMQQVRLSGRLLPSARAWLVPENLLVSEPTQNVQQIADGQTMILRGERRGRAVQRLEHWMTVEQQKLQSGAYNSDPARRAKIQNAMGRVQQKLNTLRSESATLAQQGKALVEAGKVIRSLVISVGALPNQASVQSTNPRLAGENLPMNSTSCTADLCGFARFEVGALKDDRLRTTVAFPGDGNKMGSRLTIEHLVPDPSQKPDVVVDGVKFYKARPVSAELVNEPPEAQ